MQLFHANLTIYGAEGTSRAGNHIDCALGAIKPCKTLPSCWAVIWLGRNRAEDAEVTLSTKDDEYGEVGYGM